MTTYRWHEALGGGEHEEYRHVSGGTEAPVGTVAFLVDGRLVCIAVALLTEVKPPLPEEPPVTSFVNAGSRLLHRRDDHGIDWYDLASGTWYTWAQVCELGTPVRLIPAPVPVALPWESEVSLGRRVGVSVLGGGPVIAIENADGSGSVSCHVNAREMARALNTAAEATS